MIRKALSIVGKLIFVLIIFIVNFLLNLMDSANTEVASADIDGGFIIVLLIGLSYGGYKMFLHENAQ